MGFWREDLGLLPPDEDDRLALDGDASGWNLSHAYSLTNLTALAYEPKDAIERFLPARGWDLQEYDNASRLPLFRPWSNTGWFAARRGEDLVIAIRGTEPPNLLNWATNFAFATTEAAAFVPRAKGRIHLGFAEAFRGVWPGIEARLGAFAAAGGKRLWIAGHSLGGALAVLAAAAFSLNRSAFRELQLEGLYTCGQPRVGNLDFYSSVVPLFIHRYFRMVHGADIVPHLPPDYFAPGAIRKMTNWARSIFGLANPSPDYLHAGKVYYLPSDNSTVANAVPDGYPRTKREILLRLAPALRELPRLITNSREAIPNLPEDIRHHFPRGTDPKQPSYLSKLRSLMDAESVLSQG